MLDGNVARSSTVAPILLLVTTSPEQLTYAFDTIGILRSILLGLQGFSTVMNELLQNAEDAKATEFYVRFTPEALWVGNNEVFNDENFLSLCKPGAGSKRYDSDKIGSFGIGFTSVYQLTDTPTVMSGRRRVQLLPLEERPNEKFDVDHEWPTTIYLPWAFAESETRKGLQSGSLRPQQLPGFVIEACASLAKSAVFLKRIRRLQIFDGNQMIEDIHIVESNGRRSIKTLKGEDVYIMYSAQVDTELAQQLVEQGERKSLVRFAIPEHASKTFQGYLFASLPTQERTFLPFHLDADFYPKSDRKSLQWDGNESETQRWNLDVLETARLALPGVLKQLSEVGTSSLYAFAHAALKAPEQAGQIRAAQWVQQCAQTVKRAFKLQPLVFTARNGWCMQDQVLLPLNGLSLPVELQKRIELKTNCSFPSAEDPGEFAPLFHALGIYELSAERFIPIIRQLCHNFVGSLNVWDIIESILTYLRCTIEKHPQSRDLVSKHEKELINLPFALNERNRLTSLAAVRHIQEPWTDILETWFDEGEILSVEWAATAGEYLETLFNNLTQNDLLARLNDINNEVIQKNLNDPVKLRRLYSFLSDAPFDKTKARELPICRCKDGGFYPATSTILTGEIKDSFGLFAELDPVLEDEFRPLFTNLGVRALDGDKYYKEMLPKLVSDQIEKREDILKHLAETSHLTAERLKVWCNVPIVRTARDEWVTPMRAHFDHPLLEKLFEANYHAVAKALSDDPKIHTLLEKLGVKSTPTPDRLAEIVKEKVIEPIKEEFLSWRRELIKHALDNPEVLKSLHDLPWLPDIDHLRWLSIQQLWHPSRRQLIGQQREQDRFFIGVDLTEDGAKKLGLSEPQVATVLAHLRVLVERRIPIPAEALAWLEGQKLEKSDLEKLKQLPLFQSGQDEYKKPTFFFLKPHKLAPYRGVLSESYSKKYPELIKMLDIKDRLSAKDYASILKEISQTVGDGGKVKPKAIEIVRMCLDECSKAWHSKTKETDLPWMVLLQEERVIPVGFGDDQRLYQSKNAFLLDIPESDLIRYDLEDIKPYIVKGKYHPKFLKALGVQSLKDNLQIKLLSTSTQGTESAYTQKLRLMAPSIVRYVYYLKATTPEEIESDLSKWQFVSMVLINAEISLPRFPSMKSRNVELEHDVDRENQAIMIKRNTSKYTLGVALERALLLNEGSHLSALLADTPSEAETFLDIQKIPPLPETFKSSIELSEAKPFDPGELPAGLASVDVDSHEREAVKPSTHGQADAIRDARSISSATQERSPAQAGVSADSGELAQHDALAGTISASASGVHQRELKPPADISSQPSAAEIRAAGQRSAQNAANRRDNLPNDSGLKGAGRRQGGIRRTTGLSVRRIQTRFRNFVHVSPSENSTGENVSSAHNMAIDAIGMRFVMQFEIAAGRNPRDDSYEPEGGYDIRSESEKGTRLIELKTLSGPWGKRGVTVSRKQMETAFKRESSFWLYIVENAATQPQLWCIRNPAYLATSYTFADDWADEKCADGPYPYNF